MKSMHDRLILLGILLALFISLALPQVLFAGADVQNGFACTVNALDTGLPEPLTSTDTHSVVTPGGNSVLLCKFQGPKDNIYESAYQNRGFLCGTFAGTTYNSKIVVTPSGQVIFTCHVHPNKQSQQPADQQSITTSDQPADTPPESSSEDGNNENGNGHGNGNGNSAQQGGEEPTVTSEDGTTTTPENSGPGNSGNHGNGHGNGNGGGNGNGNSGSSGDDGNGNSGGNGNGTGHGHGNSGG